MPLITVTVFTRCASFDRAARAYGVPPEIPIKLNSSSSSACATSSTSVTVSRALLRATNSERPTPGPVGSDDPDADPGGLGRDVRRLVMRPDQTVEKEGGMAAAVAVFRDFELAAVSHHEQIRCHLARLSVLEGGAP